MKRIFISLSLLFFLPSLNAQVDTAKLNQLFNSYSKHQKAMLSACISENGKIVYGKSIGFTDVEKKEKANPFTQYHIGSITKMFTAVMIFQLIDEKKLTLNTKLQKFFPTIPNSDKITISNLLNHRSGLFNFTMDSLYQTFMEQAMTEAQLISLFEKYKPDFEPNTQADYSNTNYVILTFIIEKITKNTYDKELIKRICAKVGIGDTRVGSNDNREENEAKSYSFENNQWTKSTETHLSIPRGAGAILSTPSDLCQFIEALFAGKLMSEASFNEMKAIEEDYGRGIFQMPFGAKKAYGHTGGIDEFHSALGYFPEDKMAFCITSNGLNYPMNDISIGMLSIYFKKPYTIPSFEKRVLTETEKKTIEGIYANASIGMKITLKKEGETYTAQATNQSAFPLEKVGDLEFKFDAAKIRMIFIKDKDDAILSFKLIQSGNELMFEKE